MCFSIKELTTFFLLCTRHVSFTLQCTSALFLALTVYYWHTNSSINQIFFTNSKVEQIKHNLPKHKDRLSDWDFGREIHCELSFHHRTTSLSIRSQIWSLLESSFVLVTSLKVHRNNSQNIVYHADLDRICQRDFWNCTPKLSKTKVSLGMKYIVSK